MIKMNAKGEKIFYLFCLLGLLIIDSHFCKKLPYIADEDAVIYIEAIPNCIDCGESARIILSGHKGSGYPLPDDTIVYLSASIGSLAGEVALLDGRAETIYQADQTFVGEAVVTARCGRAAIVPQQLVIDITDTDVAYLFIGADPPVLPSAGDTSIITARALDENMTPVPGKTLWLATTAGSLHYDGQPVTDQQGEINAALTTDRPATVTVRYKDIEESVEITLEEANNPPSAEFIYSPGEPRSGERVFFNAQQSSDEDGHIVSYNWDFGDGTAGRGETVSHVYHVSRTTTFVVTLKVIDNSGGTDVESKEITIKI